MNSEAYFFSLSVGKEVNTFDENEAAPNTFEVLKFFFPRLRKIGRIYPDIIISKEKTGGKKIKIGKSNAGVLIFGDMLSSFKM